MFIQIIQGRCTRQDELRALAERWRDELGPTAEGWIGGTFGFTDDDQFLGIVRFESREAAEANSRRPEQTAWAEEMAALMDGPPEFHDSDDVMLLMGRCPDSAGFVQVIRGRVTDIDRVKELFADTDRLHQIRPEILGGTLAIEPDGMFTETVLFTDEESARQGERAMPAEMTEELGGVLQDMQFMDLHQPFFTARAG